MDKNWHDLEKLLRHGERSRVLRALGEVARSRLSAADRLELARLYRRAGRPERSLQALGDWEEQRTELARAEYGAALVNLGAVREGTRILEGLGRVAASDPRVGWLRAATRIHEWDWEGAVPILRSLPESEMYLATCLIHGCRDYDRAAALLEKALRRVTAPDARGADDPRQSPATAWLLLAQSRMLGGELRVAEQALRRSRELLAPAPTAGTLLSWMLRQWELLLDLRRGKRAAARELLGPVREGFRSIEAWEWARSCPLFAAEILGDRKTLLELYWTTPYPAFRARVLRALGQDAVADRYDLRLGTSSRARLDVATGEFSVGGRVQAQLKPGQAKHRLLLALVSDLHRPHRLAELHERVFPDERFRASASQERVHKLVQRLRNWMKEGGLPLSVRAAPSGFFVVSDQGCGFGLSVARDDAWIAGPAFRKWAQAVSHEFGDRAFSPKQAMRAFRGSRRTLARRLAEASEAGWARREGSGPGVSYRLLRA